MSENAPEPDVGGITRSVTMTGGKPQQKQTSSEDRQRQQSVVRKASDRSSDEQRLKTLLTDLVPEVLSFLFAFIVGAYGIYLGVPHFEVWLKTTPGLIFLLCAVFAFVSGVVVVCRSRRKSELEAKIIEQQRTIDFLTTRYTTEINDLNHHFEHRFNHYERRAALQAKALAAMRYDFKDMIDGYLSVLVNDVLDLTETDRISIFYCNKEDFVLAGRYSKNPEYDKIGRVSYPIGQGVLGEAYKRGFAEDYFPDPHQEAEDYSKQTLERWRIPPVVSDGLVMKPRAIAGYAVIGKHKKAMAVVVVESEVAERLNFIEIREVLTKSESQRLRFMLEKYERFKPTPGFAEDKGY